MTHLLHVRDVRRWEELNEYEGEIHGELDGVPVTCYFLAAPREENWDRFAPGATVPVDAWVERGGDVRVLPPGSPGALTQVDGVIYEIVGVITQRDGEDLQVDSTLSMRVDLDLTPRTQLPELRQGDVVQVRGTLKIDLPEE